MLPVYWGWNGRAWLTHHIILDWYTNYFCPTVVHFSWWMSYQPKVLLLDNAPDHPANFSEVSTPLDITTSLFQPEDQRVRAIFKACFIHQTFMEMMRGLGSSDKTIKGCWCTFDILKVINNINTAMEEVSVNSLNALW
jgi:hypothetical protein